MTTFHADYKPGEQIELMFDGGSAIRVGAVVEGEAKPMRFLFCTQMPDGSYVAFDVREVRQLDGAFAGVSMASKARLAALVTALHANFETSAAFHAALVGVAYKMAARPAANLH